MSIQSELKDNVVTIYLDSSFDVSQYEAFKQVCADNDSDDLSFVVDFKKTLYVDSSALGMLLLLREQTKGDQERVKLINIGDTVAKIFRVAQFNKLFDMQMLND